MLRVDDESSETSLVDQPVTDSSSKPLDINSNEYHNYAMACLRKKGYDVICDSVSGTRYEMIRDLCCFNIFITTWMLSCLYPVVMVLAAVTQCWSIAIIMAAEWWVIKVLLAKNFESEAFRNSSLAMFMRKLSRNISYLHSSSIAVNQSQPSSRPCLFAYHPHGIFTLGWSMTQVCDVELLRGVRFCFADILYWTPLVFICCNMFARHGAVNSKFMKECMQRNESLALIPGGFEEATIHSKDHDRVYLSKRTGFIALAVRNGYDVRPVFSFGERTSYWNIQSGLAFRLWLNTLPLQMPGILAVGRSFLFPLLPRSGTKIHVVIGAPMRFTQIEKPTRDEVNLAHEDYVNALMEMYNDLAPILDPRQDGTKPKLEVY
eukprot:GHVH01015736.1.p1 GENE.GHVH01015736.1~~GHVH01015736.1.p1  ORF type:complete len:376 (-),score=35.28 GHVH01015736.1:362-1489(-)